jgi:HlyD family secretion protein
MIRDCGRNISLRILKMSEDNRIIRFFKKRPLVVIASAIVIIALGIAMSMVFQTEQGTTSNHVTFTVERGPLTISVIESGTIKARDQVIIKNEVEGKTSILYLIPEGTPVKKGDLLVELDASQLMDQKIDQQISVQNTEAAFVGARENLAVVENQAQSDVDKAELAYTFAKEDLKKYLEGEYPNELKEAESRLTLAIEEVTRAKENLEWSKRLANEKYISQTELEVDELTVKKKTLDVELAQNNLDLLKNFTHKRMLAQLESDVKQAKMALERTIRKAKADVVQARANLEAKKAEYERQKDKLKKIEVQIEKAKIYAPADGLVIHATSTQRGGPRRMVEPLQEGQAVMERQELIHLPTTAAAMAEVAIHEASLDKVHIGLPVKVTVDALPGETFLGRVAKIAPLPDAQSAWMNPDLKVYDTDIYLDNNSSALRTGMSCKVEIIVEQHREATYVPVQAVLRVGGQPTVYVVNGKNLEPRKVEIGLDNNRMVRIISGLEPGEVVSMTPPLAAAVVEADTDELITEIDLSKTGAKSDSGPINKGTGVSETLERRPVQGDVPNEIPKGQGMQGSNQPPYPGAGSLTSEQREKMRERLESMSPEEREKMRTLFQSMTPEERKRYRDMTPEEKREMEGQIMGRSNR